MNKSFNILRLFFHILNFATIVLYLYPGSILGWIIYSNDQHQPQITKDYLNISSNHLYAFFILSILGLFCYFNHSKFKLLIVYLFFLSIVLELFHLIIPERSFQFRDLAGNVLGVTISYFVTLIIIYWKKL